MKRRTALWTLCCRIALMAALSSTVLTAVALGGQSDPPGLDEAIAKAASEPAARGDLDIFSECRSDSGMRTLAVYGDGTGVWDSRRQFQLTPEQLGSLLKALQEADFASMPEVFGGQATEETPKVPPKNPPAFVVEITCRVEVTLGGHHKKVLQRAKGEQSQKFKKLAQQLFEICKDPSRQGIEASGLSDGLSKLAEGSLKPQTWQLMMHRRPDEASAVQGHIGFLLRIAGDTVTSRSFDPAGGYTDPLALHLSASDLRDLARSLSKLNLDGLPVNLYAGDYTDLNIRLLNHHKSVQARQFAGMTAATHGQAQKNFDALYEILRKLHVRVINEGKKPAETPSPE